MSQTLSIINNHCQNYNRGKLRKESSFLPVTENKEEESSSSSVRQALLRWPVSGLLPALTFPSVLQKGNFKNVLNPSFLNHSQISRVSSGLLFLFLFA